MSRISVVMPAHNASAWIDDTIASVLAQGDDLLEVVIANDASTDDTAARVRRHAARDPRVRLIDSDTQRGPSGARNLALDAAAGEWIAFVDADDLLLPGRLSRLLAVARAQQADAVADNLAYFREGDPAPLRTLFPVDSVPAEGVLVTPSRLLAGSPPWRADGLGLLNVLVRRDFLQRHGIRFRESVRNGEDFLFHLDTLLAGARFVLLPDVLYRYRIHPASTMVRARDVANLEAQLVALRDMTRRCDAADTAALRTDTAALAADLRERMRFIEQVQLPLLRLRASYLGGERLRPFLQLLRSPRLWLPLASRLLAFVARRAGLAPVR